MVINSIKDIVAQKGLQNEEQLHRYVFQFTGCGAWISWDDKSVTQRLGRGVLTRLGEYK